MKIKNISCSQFAGVRDREVSFNDGINVIYGKNESGKSTLVNLISRTLFQNAKIKLNSDKDFPKRFYPSAKKGGGEVGDFADGKITFEANEGTYTLSKVWGAGFGCTLSTPDGVFRDQNKISDILKELLVYGEGVYADILFSSQHNTDISLKTILDSSSANETKKSVSEAVSQAFVEGDGISVGAIGEEITKKLDAIAGKHWDYERNKPVKYDGDNPKGQWEKGLGDILNAYYRFEDAQADLDEISRLENEEASAISDYNKWDKAVRTAEEAYNTFNAIASSLIVQSERKKTIERIKKELKKNTEILSKLPQLSEKLEKARALRLEKENRNILDIHSAVNEARAELSEEDYETAKLPYPDKAEISEIKKLQREITSYENKLCSMNLTAAIDMLGDNEVKIVSVRTGESVDVTNGLASITEAVKITVPNVIEIQLSPADVDAAAVKEIITQKIEKITEIFAKYNVKALDELEEYAEKIDEAKTKIDGVNSKIEKALGNLSLTQLDELYKQIDSESRSKKEIESDISAVCGSADISTFITKTEAAIDGYTSEFGGINDLKVKCFDLEKELKKAEETVSTATNIPAEYQDITDPEAHLKELQEDLKLKRELREDALTEKTAAASRLATHKDTHPDACQETVDAARRDFEDVLSLLNHWRHIEEVFKAQKENIRNNPMQDIADRFTHYLGIISDGKVSSEFPEANKLDINIYSENRLLDYGKLSEGAKETVSLAFRLAVLDHLFPDGGGVIVFDDSFTDMDAERTAQACELIKECAKKHQIIFLTCREDYLELLGGNKIQF